MTNKSMPWDEVKKLQDKTVEAIDIDEWKSSWHLPKDKFGSIDWCKSKTWKEVQNIILGKIEDAKKRIEYMEKLLPGIAEQLKEKQEWEAEALK